MNIKAIRTAVNHLPAVAVFGVAAWQSYWHTVEVATNYGEAASAHLMPFSIDGLMMIAARYISHARTKVARIVAVVAFVFGLSMMAWINFLAADPNAFSRVIAIWPALAMALAGALLHWAPQKPVRRTTRRRTPAKKTSANNVRPMKAAA
jgi:peptidoglycan/LPS O-acetylase OafA/YrhL